jgi:Stress responsive A/B Barrel Domain
MFRQVVAMRWAEGVTPEAREGYRNALAGLRAIPELLAMTCGDDAGHFDDNFDFVAVMDFADFPAARRYVAHPLHQAYVRDHASQVIGQRVIVQHEWTASDL